MYPTKIEIVFSRCSKVTKERKRGREEKKKEEANQALFAICTGWLEISHLPSNRYLAGAVPRGITGTGLLYVLYKNSEQREILMMLLLAAAVWLSVRAEAGIDACARVVSACNVKGSSVRTHAQP